MRALEFDADGAHWPNREHSVFLHAGGVRWHVQRAGEGPALLLLHGTGSSTHTWRDCLPRLAERFDAIAVDLPGQGFSRAGPQAMSLPGMSDAVAALLSALGRSPAWVVGHSAGAAVSVQLALDGRIAPVGLIGINPALHPLRGPIASLFAPLARMAAGVSIVPRLFSAFSSDAASVRRLLRKTGSRIDDRGVALYRTLVGNEVHVANTLEMMARWDLSSLSAPLPRLTCPFDLIVGMRDQTVPPAHAEAAARRLAGDGVRVHRIPDAGHLVHEEQPERVVSLIERIAARQDPDAFSSPPAAGGTGSSPEGGPSTRRTPPPAQGAPR